MLAVRPADGAIFAGSGAVKAGDTLELFATGLGAAQTPVPAVLVFSGAYPTSATPHVTIGDVQAPVSYAGLVGAGLYQINLTVPVTLVTGTYPVTSPWTASARPPPPSSKWNSLGKHCVDILRVKK